MSAPPPADSGSSESLKMQCMEVWGGNEPTSRNVELTGLQAWVYSLPYPDCKKGGDVYYLSSCASGRISRMLIADVAGHGDLVDSIARGLRDLMRRNINFIKQGRLFRALNEQFGELRSAGRFATAIVITFFAPRSKLEISTAGHPLPLLYRKEKQTWEPLASVIDLTQLKAPLQNVPLGVLDEALYGEVSLRLSPGDLLLLFSDGLLEYPTGPSQLLGPEGLLSVLRQLPPEPRETLIPRILEAITGHSEPRNRRDDLTIVLLSPTGRGIPMKNNLLAPWRLVSALWNRDF
jgi:serine phosphatase RsbU (regulator of sigma subunit)